MGCLILATIGLLFGLVLFVIPSLLVVPGAETGTRMVGLIFVVVSIIAWMNWAIKQAHKQELKQLQERVLQTPLPQPKPPQEQPRKRQWIRDE